MTQSFKNQFLVALPALKEDYFHDTISLLIDHNEQGAFGLIINRPLNHDIGELFADIDNGFTCPVLMGGPVEQERAFFLHPTGPQFEATLQISEEISLTTSPDIISAMKMGSAPDKLITIMGYAGWGATQLENELSENIWLLAPTKGAVVFDVPYDKRTTEAARQMGVDLNLMPTFAGHD